ncbi:MAG: AMP-binding protein [Halocynthiibacter sp.]
MDTRLIQPAETWDQLRAEFHWDIPPFFNMAEACVSRWARHDPDRLALIHVDGAGEETRHSFGELEEKSTALAAHWREKGIGKGDVVAILLSQSPEVLIAHFAAYKLGAIALPLFVLFGEDALAYRLLDSAAKCVVTDEENLPKVAAIRAKLPELAWIYTTTPCDGAAHFSDAYSHPVDAFSPLRTHADDPAVLIYTSGTTGSPKGVLHAHRFLIGHLPTVEISLGFFPQDGDRGWTPADWAWIGGLMDMAMPCLYHGVSQLSCRMRKFDPDYTFELIDRYQLKNLFLPPTALKVMRRAKAPKEIKLRSISSGGEALGDALQAWAKEVLGAPINELYGQTECNLSVTSCAQIGAQKAGTIGRATPGFDIAILDENGAECPTGQIGEIAVKSPNPIMMLRYLNKPDETTQKFRGPWLLTGDMGQMDADGYIRFSARADDVITSAGYRVGPAEIEECLITHEDVVNAAVVGIPDLERTERIKAFIVLRGGASWEGMEEALIALVKARISPHVAPREVVQIAALPMTATGKVLRRDLKAL